MVCELYLNKAVKIKTTKKKKSRACSTGPGERSQTLLETSEHTNSQGAPLKTFTMGGVIREQGTKDKITTNFKAMNPTSQLTTIHFMDEETEAQKTEPPKDTGLKPRPPRQGSLPPILLCPSTRGIGRFLDVKRRVFTNKDQLLQKLLGRTQMILGKLQNNQPKSEVSQIRYSHALTQSKGGLYKKRH